MKNSAIISITDKIIKRIEFAIESALSYEKEMCGKRKLGITAEVGEILACYHLGIKLVLDPRSEGFDAIDKDGRLVQIKTRRSESEGLPRDAGRVGSFSKHKFDYALLVLLDNNYKLCEIWKADYNKLKPIIDHQKRRNPNLSYFKRVSEKIYDRRKRPIVSSGVGQNRDTGAAANEFGHDMAARVARFLGTKLLSNKSNEVVLHGKRVVIKSARWKVPKIGVSLSMLSRVDEIIAALQEKSGDYTLYRVNPQWYRKQMIPSRSKSPSAHKIMMVRCNDIRNVCEVIDKMKGKIR